MMASTAEVMMIAIGVQTRRAQVGFEEYKEQVGVMTSWLSQILRQGLIKKCQNQFGQRKEMRMCDGQFSD